MKILFCNISYMIHYEGQTSRDITPTGAGKWVKENQDAHEKWNFLNYDGYCYGFVQNKGQFCIEHFEDVEYNENATDGVTIIWCAPLGKEKTVIVGWYENAKMYREYQYSICTPVTGIDRAYFSKAKAEDCYLLPEELRTFEIGRASVLGIGKGFGQQNYWYADSEYAKTELIPKVLSFISSHKKDRINRLSDFFAESEAANIKLSDKEKKEMDIYYDNGEYDKYLSLGYKKFKATGSADDAFYIAAALKELYQFSQAIKWYEKVVEIEGESWDTYGNMVYLYEQINQHEKAIEIAKCLLKYPQSKQDNVKEELYGIIADNEHYLGNDEEAIKWLDKILDTTTNKVLIEHTKKIKKSWS
ncbi:MAG: tetratricopeptide repeat protein [Lachnospiraceae bacterium]|nr:tetratricopeptide repeat protein [Lachnospiraceae bacterium]